MKNNIVVFDKQGEMVVLIYLKETEVATQTGYSVRFLTDEELDELEEDGVSESESIILAQNILSKNRIVPNT